MKRQHVEALHNSVNQYFPNDQYRVLRNHIQETCTEHTYKTAVPTLNQESFKELELQLLSKCNPRPCEKGFQRLPFPTACLWEAGLFKIYFKQNSRMQSMECRHRQQCPAVFYLGQILRFADTYKNDTYFFC